MTEHITRAINLWYKEWLKTNEPYEAMPDFEMLLEQKFPNLKFSLSGDEWIFIGEY
jgi:hypothetical protein